MKLYEINTEIEALLAELSVDPETGEVPADTDEIISRLECLSMERQSVLEYLAKIILNLRSDMESMEFEIKRLEDRKARCKKRIDSIMKVLDRECDGKRTELGVATVSYRASESTDVTDEKAAIEFLTANGYNNCTFVTQPKINIDKAGVKALIKNGVEVPGVNLVRKNNCSLK